MKRAIGIVFGLAVSAAALAQAPFTIVRPADGSRVRERVRVQIPKDSVPNGGYVGIFVGGKFVEALIPTAKGRFYEYILDTKGRGIPDGSLKLEAVLYMDSDAAAPKILDRSSVTVSVQNKANIKIPSQGLLLRYAFTPDTALIYKHVSRTSVSVISEAEAKMGGRAAELPLEYDVIRLMYAIDQRYSNGDGLVRLQALPPRGKDYLYYNAALEGEDASESRLYSEPELGALYMRLTSTGKERFTSIPFYYPMEGTAGAESNQLYILRPLPTLPTKRVKPGDTWESRFQMPKPLDRGKLNEISSAISPLQARGEFLGVEWEMGRPTAKLRNVITVGSRTLEGTKLAGQGRDFTEEKVSMEEISWFALDKKIIVRSVINLVVDRKVPASQQMQGGGLMGGGPAGGPSGGPQIGGAGGGGGGGNSFDDRQAGGRRGGPQGFNQGPQMGGAGNPGQRQGGRGATGQGRGPAGGTQWQRIRTQIILVLEQ